MKRVKNHLDEGVIHEILARLPARSVLRARFVCKEWRRITASASFLADHARHRPPEVLAYTEIQDPVSLDIDLQLDALAVSGPALRRRVARFPKQKPRDEHGAYQYEQYCPLLASCDGLLLFAQGAGDYLVCNPATRQWSGLPRLEQRAAVNHRELGFYLHGPSGEYRLLCHCNFSDESAAYYVLSAGADEPRRLAAQATPVRGHHPRANSNTPAVLGGLLHWLQHPEAGPAGSTVAFDAAAETFRRMPPPPVASSYDGDVRLVAADGLLMAARLRLRSLDLWALEGYGGAEERWERRQSVELPLPPPTVVAPPCVVAGGDEGDVILGTCQGLVVYNVRSRTARVVVESECKLSRRVLRESLVPHGFFEARPHPGLPLFKLY